MSKRVPIWVWVLIASLAVAVLVWRSQVCVGAERPWWC